MINIRKMRKPVIIDDILNLRKILIQKYQAMPMRPECQRAIFPLNEIFNIKRFIEMILILTTNALYMR